MIQPPLYLTNSDCRRWLLWRSILQGHSKPKKVPFYANGSPRKGQLDGESDLKQLVSYQEAKAVFDRGSYTGLGFALGPDGNGGYWQGVDLDNIDQHPELASLNLPGYVEISPSHKGKHAIGYGRTFDSLGSNKSGIEAYSRGRYFTFTSNVNGVCPDTPVDLADYVENTLRPIHGKSRGQLNNDVRTKSPSIQGSKIPYIKNNGDLYGKQISMTTVDFKEMTQVEAARVYQQIMQS